MGLLWQQMKNVKGLYKLWSNEESRRWLYFPWVDLIMPNPYSHKLQSPACAGYSALTLDPAFTLFHLPLSWEADPYGHYWLPLLSGFRLDLADEGPWKETGAKKEQVARYLFHCLSLTPRVSVGLAMPPQLRSLSLLRQPSLPSPLLHLSHPVKGQWQPVLGTAFSL